MGTMDIWYAHLDEDELMAAIRSAVAGTAKEAKARSGEGTSGRAKQEKGGEKEEAELAKTAQKRAEKTA